MNTLPENNPPVYAGLDIAKATLQLHLQGRQHALPNTAATQQLMSACVANGGGAWDHSGLVKALELMGGHKVAND